MHCEKHKELLQLWWNDQLTEAERAELRSVLTECEDCRRELEADRKVWALMAQVPVPEPSRDMQASFNAMLDDYKASVAGSERRVSVGIGAIGRLFRLQPWLAAAFSLILLAGGFGIGYVAHPPAAVTRVQAVSSQPQLATDNQQLQALTKQIHEMREMVMLSLLQNPSASERMRGISYTSDIRNVNPDIATALLETLNNDPNVNVRLTTLEALTQYAGNPAVREGLVQSILRQQSPLVQAAMADVMLKLQEKRSVRPFKKLLQQKDLNEMVRTKIEQTITRLT